MAEKEMNISEMWTVTAGMTAPAGRIAAAAIIPLIHTHDYCFTGKEKKLRFFHAGTLKQYRCRKCGCRIWRRED